MFNQTILLSPHTDDGEASVGGTGARLIERGKNVFYVAFSSAKRSIPDGFPQDSTEREVFKATEKLGIERANVTLLDYPVRDFPLHRQRILEDMVRLNKELKPDVVFLPSFHDTHQDHQVIAQEGFRAFKRSCSIFGYEMPGNNIIFSTDAFICLDERHITKKEQAIECYASQKARGLKGLDLLRNLARVRGAQIGTKYAEAFEVIRWITR